MSYPLNDPPRYRLAPHVRACSIDDQVVLLDLHRNKYIGVGGSQLPSLAGAIAGWPNCTSRATRAGVDLDASLRSLVEQQLLVQAVDAGPPHHTLNAATSSVAAALSPDRPLLRLGQLANLYCCAAIASHWIKRLSLAGIATRVAALRQNNSHPQTDRHAALSTAAATYLRLRPFVLTAHDQCLHDSLTLVRYLSRQGLHAHWVIGVRTRPFGAHSWVQSGGLVLNDLHETVREFTPILVV